MANAQTADNSCHIATITPPHRPTLNHARPKYVNRKKSASGVLNRTQFQFACWNDKQKVFKNYRPSKPCIGVLVTVTKRLKASQTLLVWMPTAKTGCRRAKVWLAAFLDQPFFALRPILSPSPPVTVQTAWRSTSRGLSNQILDRVVKIGLVFSNTRK